eukprot:TRINITY_DN1862_c0_g2_i1.p1 TRINITY_DN1862_c0_g2~~TRINITY_DN1862_c0_g2_i1.p1  ORF type:complete len:1099 (-),score=538.71 TRINITY_DN1862_c0_g2_i1:444-3605(-)
MQVQRRLALGILESLTNKTKPKTTFGSMRTFSTSSPSSFFSSFSSSSASSSSASLFSSTSSPSSLMSSRFERRSVASVLLAEKEKTPRRAASLSASWCDEIPRRWSSVVRTNFTEEKLMMDADFGESFTGKGAQGEDSILPSLQEVNQAERPNIYKNQRHNIIAGQDGFLAFRPISWPTMARELLSPDTGRENYRLYDTFLRFSACVKNDDLDRAIEEFGIAAEQGLATNNMKRMALVVLVRQGKDVRDFLEYLNSLNILRPLELQYVVERLASSDTPVALGITRQYLSEKETSFEYDQALRMQCALGWGSALSKTASVESLKAVIELDPNSDMTIFVHQTILGGLIRSRNFALLLQWLPEALSCPLCTPEFVLMTLLHYLTLPANTTSSFEIKDLDQLDLSFSKEDVVDLDYEIKDEISLIISSMEENVSRAPSNNSDSPSSSSSSSKREDYEPSSSSASPNNHRGGNEKRYNNNNNNTTSIKSSLRNSLNMIDNDNSGGHNARDFGEGRNSRHTVMQEESNETLSEELSNEMEGKSSVSRSSSSTTFSEDTEAPASKLIDDLFFKLVEQIFESITKEGSWTPKKTGIAEFDKALALVSHLPLPVFKVQADTAIYNLMIKALAMQDKFKRAEHLFHYLKKNKNKNATLTKETYENFIEGCCQAGLLRPALERFQELIIEIETPTRPPSQTAPVLTPTPMMFYSLFRLLLINKLWAQAVALSKYLVHCESTNDPVLVGVCFHVIREICRSRLQLTRALEFFSNMMAANITPSQSILSLLITRCASRSFHSDMLRLMGDMHRLGISADEKIYAAAVQGCCKVNDLDRAIAILHTFNLRLPLSYNYLINSLKNKDRCQDAMKVYDVMLQKGVQPDRYTLGIIVSTLVKLNRFEEAIQMSLDAPQRSIVSFTTIIDGLGKVGNIELATKIFYSLEEYGVSPNLHTFTAMIQAHCNVGDTDTALKLLDLARSFDVQVSILPYNLILQAFVRNGESEKARDLFNQLSLHRLYPNRFTTLQMKLARQQIRRKTPSPSPSSLPPSSFPSTSVSTFPTSYY